MLSKPSSLKIVVPIKNSVYFLILQTQFPDLTNFYLMFLFAFGPSFMHVEIYFKGLITGY